MAYHYSANQYELAYKPSYLRNWEVPKIYSHHTRPKQRFGRTKIVANDKGHILPGYPKSDDNPWGNYVGTWHLPNKIDRKTAEELNGLVKFKKEPCKEKILKEKLALNLEKEGLESDKNQPSEGEPVKEIAGQENDLQKEPEKIEENVTKSVEDAQPEKETNEDNNILDCKKAKPYVPGDFTEEKHRPDSYNDLVKKRYDNGVSVRDSSQGYPKYRDDFSRKEPPSPQPLSDQVVEFYDKHKDMLHAEYNPPNFHKGKSKKDRITTPIRDAIFNFTMAKKLHRENLEHEPLPDTIVDSVYRKLQMDRHNLDPGLALKNGSFATGVGWKGYPGYGPTRCTKLKVYRPKTCVQNKVIEKDERPSSVSSFDKKWRFIRQHKVSPIQLAICWDMTPENKFDEPKPPTHIDGSNGSLAPAVFSLVHSPKENAPKEDDSSSTKSAPVNRKCDGIHECGPLFEHTSMADQHPKDYFFHRTKTTPPKEGTQSLHSSSSSSTSGSKRRAKSAYNLNRINDLKVDGSSNNKKSNAPRDNNNKDNNNNNTCDNTRDNKNEKNNGQNDKNGNCNNINRNHSNGNRSTKSANITKKFHKSAPNLHECCCCCGKHCVAKRTVDKLPNSRLCIACELRNLPSDDKKPTIDYKMAFKAGIPQKRQFVSNLSHHKNLIKVPKQIKPYRDRSYVICSLAPPFSLQKNHSLAYPDHWRLATVYQQSYKPLEARKKSLMATIFK